MPGILYDNGSFETVLEISQCCGLIELKKGNTNLLGSNCDTIKHPVRLQPNVGEAEMMALGITFLAPKEFKE